MICFKSASRLSSLKNFSIENMMKKKLEWQRHSFKIAMNIQSDIIQFDFFLKKFFLSTVICLYHRFVVLFFLFLVNLCYRIECIYIYFSFISIERKVWGKKNIYKVIIITLETNQFEFVAKKIWIFFYFCLKMNEAKQSQTATVKWLCILFYLAFITNRFVNGVKLRRFFFYIFLIRWFYNACFYVIAVCSRRFENYNQWKDMLTLKTDFTWLSYSKHIMGDRVNGR